MEIKRATDEELLQLDTMGRIRVLMLEALHLSLYSDRTPVSLPQACRELRLKCGLTTRGFADSIQVSHASVSRIENGSGFGTPALLRRMAERARELHMGNTADYFQFQAMQVERKVRAYGGRLT